MNDKRLFISLCIVFISHFAVKAQVTGYNYPVSEKPSLYYDVSSANKEIVVYDNPIASIAAFDIRGNARITIKTKIDLKWVDVRPHNLNVHFTFADSTIIIKLTGPCKLSVEINGRQEQPLFVFANSPVKIKPSTATNNFIFYAAGQEYNAGQIELKSNQTLYIEGGAVVLGWVIAKDAKNITITGNGILDGSHNQDNHEYHRGIDLQNLKNVAIGGIILSNGTTWEVVPENCENVTINNLKIVSHGNSDDGIDVVSSRNVTIENCFIRTKDDCIAIKANSALYKNAIVDHILVKDCTIWNGPWGNGFEIGFELDAPEVKNIAFKDCDIIHIEKGAAMSIHNAGRSIVHHIAYENIRIEDARGKLFDFAIFDSQYSIDGPKTQAERNAGYLNGAWDGVTNIPAAQKPEHAMFRGFIHDISITNVKIIEGGFPFSIFYGFDLQHKVNHINIKNLSVYGKKMLNIKQSRFYTENASAISFE